MSNRVWFVFFIGAIIQILALVLIKDLVMLKIVTGASLALMSIPLLTLFGILVRSVFQMAFVFSLIVLGAIGIYQIFLN